MKIQEKKDIKRAFQNYHKHLNQVIKLKVAQNIENLVKYSGGMTDKEILKIQSNIYISIDPKIIGGMIQEQNDCSKYDINK